MKVYIFIDRYPYYSETFIYNQFAELIRQGIDARIIYLNHSGIRVDHGVVMSIDEGGMITELNHGFRPIVLLNIFRYPLKSYFIFRYYSIRKSLFYILNLKTLVEIENSDILHTHFGRVGEIAAKLYAAKVFSKVKLVNSFHGIDITPNRLLLYRKEYVNLFKYASLLVVNSPYSLNLLKGIDATVIDRTILLPVGVNQDLFRKISNKRDNSDFSVVYAGRLIRFKGAIIALNIAKILSKKIPNFKLHLIGDGDDFQMLFSFVQEHGLNDIVIFHGAISQENVQSIFSNSSVFISPGITDPETGRSENQGLVIQEAQAMGLPVIVSDAGGMQYGLIDGETGFVVKEGNVDLFCDRILYFYFNPDEVINFGRSGKSFVESNFRNDFLTKQLISNYKIL